MTQADLFWSFPVSQADIPSDGRTFRIAADAATRLAVRNALRLLDLPRLEAEMRVEHAAGDGLRVSGTLSASVVQSCVVSLEPVASEVREPIDVTFAPPTDEPPVPADEIEIDADAADPPDPLVNGRIDLGAVAVEFLQLGLDPYPRRPDAAFAAPGDAASAANPFAALAALKAVRREE